MNAATPQLPQEMSRRTTLGRRLTIVTTLIFCSILALTDTVIYLGTVQGQRANLDATLMSIARSEIASSTDGPNGQVHIHEEGNLLRDSQAGAGYIKYAQIEDAQNRVLVRTANLVGQAPLGEDRVQEARGRAGQTTFANITLGSEPLRCIYYPFEDLNGRPLLAAIAISKRPMEQSIRTLQEILLLSLLIGGIGAGACMYCVARKITEPLRKIATAAHQVGEKNLALRIPEIAQDRELYQVTSVLNQMLERLETAFIQQQTLIASQRRFIADASHELRSPLTNLRSTVEVSLRRQRTPEDYKATLEMSLIEIERLSRLVNDLLTLSRADKGQFQLNKQICDLQEVVRISAAAHLSRAEEAQICLSSGACVSTIVLGDSDRLRQVVDNLLDNALRYAPAKSTIKIRLKPQGNAAILSIADMGPGLSQEMQAHIFERFYRADASRARQSGGMGLGLAIVKAIVEAHGGEVSVQSILGQGTTFQISLPLAEDNPMEDLCE